MISATNILDHIKSIGTWVDWDKSLDKVTWGDPHKIISKMMIAWMPSNEVFRQCLDWNADALLTHEAIFNWLVDEAPDSRDEFFFTEKLQLLNQSNFTVIRCHDVWDLIPKVGVHDTWVKGLGFDSYPSARPNVDQNSAAEKNLAEYTEIIELPGISLKELCRHVLEKVRRFGVREVQYVGDGAAVINRVLLATGAIGTREQFVFTWEKGADAGIFTDEINYWSSVYWARDVGLNCIFVPHSVSEAFGMESMAKFFENQFPQIEIKFSPEGTPHHSTSDEA